MFITIYHTKEIKSKLQNEHPPQRTHQFPDLIFITEHEETETIHYYCPQKSYHEYSCYPKLTNVGFSQLIWGYKQIFTDL